LGFYLDGDMSREREGVKDFGGRTRTGKWREGRTKGSGLV